MKGKLLAAVSAIVAALAVVSVAFVVCIAPQAMTEPSQPGEALPAPDSLAEEDGAAPSVAASYEADSAEKFAGVMHIEDAQGNELSLGDIPTTDYSGFLFKPADGTSEAAASNAKVRQAADLGLVKRVAGGFYEVASLDTLAGLLDADDLSLLEPNFTLHLVGDVDEAPETYTALMGEEAASGQEGAASTPAATSRTIPELVANSAHALVTTLGGTDKNPAPDWPPTDQNYAAGKLWNLDMLNVKGAWELGLDGDPYVYNNTPVRETPVRVAIIDTGLYGTGTTETPHEDFDYDRIDVGYDWIHGDAYHAPDAKGHGTFVAGLIGAKVHNTVGVAGLMPNVVMSPEKVFDTGSASTANVINAIYHAAGENGGTKADVINMSLGGEYNESSLEEACDFAVSQGVLVVASAGNDGVSTPNYPAAYDNVVGVASVNSAKERSTWSQYGVSVFVTAPGESVTSTYNEGSDSYTTASGTSFSGPEVAALAAMCKSVYPDIDQDTFKDFLIETSDQLQSYEHGEWNQNFGYGLVNFTKMATAVLASQTLPWYDVTFNVTDQAGNAIQGARVELTAAEDIAWEADHDAVPAFDAGTLAKGSAVDGGLDGTWKVHRGTYAYKVTAPGFYTMSGTLRTMAENQEVGVKMPAAFETTVSVIDSAGVEVNTAELTVSSAARLEEPKSAYGNVAVYDLASGSYAYKASANGFEDSAGTFNVAFSPKALNAVLYRTSELRTVKFACRDAEDAAKLLENAGIVVTDASGTAIAAQEDGSYRLAAGATYTAIASKVGYENGVATFTVGDDAEQTVAITMTPAANRITFNVTDADTGDAVADVTVKVTKDGVQVQPRDAAGLVFGLVQGSYTYEVSAPGYEARQGSLNVATSSFTLNIALGAIPQAVTFNVTDAESGQPIADAALKVSTGKTQRSIPGSGYSFMLAPGAYRYTAYKQGYSVSQGTFAVGGSALSVDVALQKAPASATQFAGGSGTEQDPYLIATEEQLRYLAHSTAIVRMSDASAASNVTRTLTGCYKLVADIALTSEWQPIGNEESSSNFFRFGGVFDGDGHVVSNVRVANAGLDYQGFFGSVVGATIRNLTVTGPGVEGSSYVGGLVGRAYYAYSSEFPRYNTPATTIQNCGSELDVSGRYAVAGIVGSAQATNQDNAGDWVDPGTGGGITLTGCYNTGVIAASEDGAFTVHASSAGGIVGSAQQVVIADCYNKGSVQAGYNAGGIAGNSRLCSICTSYNAGAVSQHVTYEGYAGRQGGIVGNAYYTLASDCYSLKDAGGSANNLFGTTDSASIYRSCSMPAYADMYRTASFVASMNANTTTGEVGSSFIMGRDFPLLSWQVAPGALLAPAPRVTVQPQGVDAAHAYKQGDTAAALTAQVEVGSLVGHPNAITWQWYASHDAQGKDAQPVAGAVGAGTSASLVPPTDTIGIAYYRCVFTNTVTAGAASDSASTRTSLAAVYVRSATDAQAPVITKLNPSQGGDVNTTLTVKCGTEAALSVVASVSDGGQLSYQWYEQEEGTTTPTPIEGATGPSYDADTSKVGTRSYYVFVTNTLSPGNATTTQSQLVTVNVTEYTIGTYEELVAFRTEVNNGANFALIPVRMTADIAIPEGVDWEPIGTEEHPFCGLFYGGKGIAGSKPEEVEVHKVTNLSIDGTNHGDKFLGLFGYTQDACIFDVLVQGSITGKSNTYAGLLVGYASTYNTSSSRAYIENCATLADSSVEGKYLIGGLVGSSGSDITNCANHASVTARAFAKEPTPTATGLWSVGGVVGYSAGTSEVIACYNTGAVSVEAIGADAGQAQCAEYVGGVVAYTGAHSGVYSSFNSGEVTVGTTTDSPLLTRGKVRYAGAVAGYVSYGSSNCANLHYREGSFVSGGNDDAGDGLASMHSAPYFRTKYFVEELQAAHRGYSAVHFTWSGKGVPHFYWEADNVDADYEQGRAYSAEPHMIDVISKDMPRITTQWRGVYYVGGAANPIYLLAESVDGGVLTFRWQKRPLSDSGKGFDVGWENIPDTGTEVWVKSDGTEVDESFTGAKYRAGRYTIPRDSTADSAQYRCVVRNVVTGAPEDEPPMESATNPITITVRDASQAIFLKDPNEPNSADNPWVVDTPVRLKFLADVVSGAQSLPGLSASTFAGQYVQMTDDIDLSGYSNWTPIGVQGDLDHSRCFQGYFDGGNHAVTGLRIERTGTSVLDGSQWDPTDYTGIGLFGGLYLARISNLEVAGSVYLDNGRHTSTTNNAWMTGGIAGYAWGTYFSNVVNRASVTGYEAVGGIVGYASNCRLFNCENMGEVGVNGSALLSSYKGIQVGGVVGYLTQTNAGTGAGAGAYNCFNGGKVTGRVTRDGDYRFGAVVGERAGGCAVANCMYAPKSVDTNDGTGQLPTGIGGGNNGRAPGADESGVTECVSSDGLYEAAWKLNTAGVTALGVKSGHSASWGVFARADAGQQGDAVHLVRGASDKAVYKVDTTSQAADVKATPQYACPGESVSVSWSSKPGFNVKSVAYVASGSTTPLGTGASGTGTIKMPAADVSFAIDAAQDLSYLYRMSAQALLSGSQAPASVGTVSVAPQNAAAGSSVAVTLTCGSSYQVKSVTARTAYGDAVALAKRDGLSYSFTAPAADVVVTVEFEPAGAQAATRAPSLQVDRAATHRYSPSAQFHAGNLLYQAIAFSGSYFTVDEPFMVFEMEGSTTPGLYTQRYTFSDGSAHTYTGIDIAAYIRAVGSRDIAADTPVSFECLDGTQASFTFGDLTSLGYSSYDASGQPDVRGLPVLLYFGCDGTPNAGGGAAGIVFGQKSAGDANGAKRMAGITRVRVGDDVDHSMHMWQYKNSGQTIDFTNMDLISGGKTDSTMGQTTLHVRVYEGADSTSKLTRERTMTLPEIEAMARADRAGIQRGFYSTYLYENNTEASSGPYTDYYEGYDLYKVLEACGVGYVSKAKVQFYQTGMNGLDKSWKTIDVSLGYLAGNGPSGKGDYSNNLMRYAGDGYVSSGTVTGLRPMIVYGKNGVPLVWSSGTYGVDANRYNYRGPMMAFLPENSAEGGNHVGSRTATGCYLGLIDVYLDGQGLSDIGGDSSGSSGDAGASIKLSEALDQAIAESEAFLASGIVPSDDGSDVAVTGRWAPTAKIDALRSAIAKAREVAANPNASAAAVRESVAALQKAVDDLNASMSAGSLPAGSYAGSGQVRAVAKPTVATGLVYDGTEHRGVASSADYTLSGDVKATLAGTYVAYAVPKSGYVWPDGTPGKIAVTWSISRARVSKPVAASGLVYSGRSQVGVPAGIGYALAGAEAVDAGTYTAQARPYGNYAWADGTTSTIQIRWSIAKRAQAITIERASYAKTFGDSDFKVSAYVSGEGQLSFASLNGKVIAVDKASGKASVRGAGSTTVVVSCPESKNFTAAKSKSVKITVAKAANPITVKAKKAKLKAKKLKKAKRKVKPLKVTKAQGKVTCKILKINGKKRAKSSLKKRFKISSAGKVTIAKRTKRATYKLKVRVKAAGNANYKAKTITKTVKIRVV